MTSQYSLFPFFDWSVTTGFSSEGRGYVPSLTIVHACLFPAGGVLWQEVGVLRVIHMSINMAWPYLKPCTQTLSTARGGVQYTPSCQKLSAYLIALADPYKTQCCLQDIMIHRPQLTGFMYPCKLDKHESTVLARVGERSSTATMATTLKEIYDSRLSGCALSPAHLEQASQARNINIVTWERVLKRNRKYRCWGWRTTHSRLFLPPEGVLYMQHTHTC